MSNPIEANWHRPATIERNRFKFKSLSCWSYNIAIGCGHGCAACYVPAVSTRKMGAHLTPRGVGDPDADWGNYVFLRQWNENAFLASLGAADNAPLDKLNVDGNRAVMLCTTTDPYQVFESVERQAAAEKLVSRALQLILERSTLNVRILTRSTLAVRDFDLMRRFGNRLLFGMSIPTLDDEYAAAWEPHAPAPSKRLECLRAAKAAGLNVFAAVAPTFPSLDSETLGRPSFRADLLKTMNAVASLDPVTVFAEPVNIRGNNIERVRRCAMACGVKVNLDVFESKARWAGYAMESLLEIEHAATRAGLYDRLHLWPDQDLAKFFAAPQDRELMERYWTRISEWPGRKKLTKSD